MLKLIDKKESISALAVRVLIICNHQLLTTLLVQLLQSAPDRFELVGTVNHSDDSIEQLRCTQPDIVLYDTDSSAEHLMQMLLKLHATSPSSKVLLFGSGDNVIPLDEALILGARGLLDPNVSPGQLLHAIEKVHEGQVWLDRSTTARVFVDLARKKQSGAQDPVTQSVASLTERERKVVITIASNSDLPRKVIADKLHISDSTLRNHLSVIYEKLKVNTRGGLVAYAMRNGLTGPAE